MYNPHLFAVTACGSNSEKARAVNINSSIPRHKCRGNGKTTDYMDTHYLVSLAT